GGTFKSGAANLSFSNNFVINSTGGTIDNSNKRLTLTGIISDGTGTPAQLQIIGGHKGVTILTNNNSNYSGGTLVSGTTLQLKANTAPAPGPTTLDDALFQPAAANLKIANNFQINNTPDGSAIDSNGRVLTLSGNISDGNGPGALPFINTGALGNSH